MYHFEPLDALLDSIPKNYLIPAVDMLILKDGKEIYRHAAGYSDKKRTRPAGKDDLYAIYSSSKIATCVSALRLVEQGKLSLEDPVSKYIPAFGDLTVKEEDGTVRPAKTVMTIRHLMSMQGGLDYEFDRGNPEEVFGENYRTAGTVDFVSTFAKAPLLFDPGTHYQYSLCHDVLGAVIEVASGERFGDFMKRELFDPLGMKDTGFHPTKEQMERMSYFVRADYDAYTLTETGERENPTENYESGGGGLVSSVDDYIELIYALANNGTSRNGYQVLKPETLELYRTPQLGDVQQADFKRIFGYMTGYTYCLGVRRMLDNSGLTAAVGNFGWDGAAGFYVLADPENKIAMIYAQNVLNSSPTFSLLHGQLRDMMYLCLREWK